MNELTVIEIDLGVESAINKNSEIPPNERFLGGDEPDLQANKIRMYIGNRPIVFNLKQLYRKSNKQVPPEIQIFKSYNAYILTHTIGVIKDGGWDKIHHIGFRVEFPKNSDIIVLDVMPQSKFITTIGGKFQFEADFNLNGELSLPKEVSTFLENIENVGIGGKLKVATDNSLVGRFSFSVISPEVVSIGKGSNYSEWIFYKSDKPLHGNDIEMYQIVLVDRDLTELSYRSKLYSVISSSFMSSMRESEWIDVKCKLN